MQPLWIALLALAVMAAALALSWLPEHDQRTGRGRVGRRLPRYRPECYQPNRADREVAHYRASGALPPWRP